ncbi:MAG: hypothetical protein LKJ88_04600 [Bacilli bacterium]|nr:hypothetical protein [Bacilli bacterium]
MKKTYKLLFLGLALISLASCGEGGISGGGAVGGITYSNNYNNNSSSRNYVYTSVSVRSSSSSSSAYVAPTPTSGKSAVKNYLIANGTRSSRSGDYYVSCGYSTLFYYSPTSDKFEIFSYIKSSDATTEESFLIEFYWGSFASASGIFEIDVNSSKSFVASISGFTMGSGDWQSILFKVTYCESSSLLQNGKDCLGTMATTATAATESYLTSHSLPSMY